MNQQNDFTLDELLAEQARRKSAKQAPAQKPMIQDPTMNAMLERAMGKQNVGTAAGNFLTTLGGGEPNKLDDYSKLYAQEAIKKSFEKPNYVVSYDKDGQPVFTEAPGEIRNAPFYSSPQGGQYYQAKTGEAQAKETQATTETGLMNRVMPLVDSALSGNPGAATPGTKINVGPVSVPLNPELTESEARTFGTAPVLNDAVQKFVGLAQKGTLNSANPMSSAGKGFAVDQGWAPLTFGQNDLSSMQAELNRIKANTLFSEGGKNLTANERQVIEALFSVTGKDQSRIVNDVQEGVRKYNEFIAAKKGGMLGYQPGNASPQADPGGFLG